MTITHVTSLEDVAADLQIGKSFYDTQEQGVGSYFRDSIIADIESLYLYGGVHTKQHGLYRMMAKRFPFAIYYDVVEETAVVYAVLDMRRNPRWIESYLSSRKL